MIASQQVPPPNLFTPDFGQSPHLLVGRDDLYQALVQGLGSGPRDSRYTTLLLGPRGSGKTVMLNAIRDIASRSGWIVLSLDATTAGIQDRITEYIEWAQDSSEGDFDATPRNQDEHSSIRFKLLPLEWHRGVVQAVRPNWGLRRQLSTLADRSAERDCAVLLTIDELHSGQRDELRRLTADLQHIIKSEGRQLAFVGAGLSEMKHTLLEDKKMTFLQRCNREAMPPITRVEAARFLCNTVHDAGGRFEGESLQTLTDGAGTLPYQMQLVGHYAWRIADAPLRPITEEVASVAVTEATRTMHDRIATPTWHGLNTTEQQYLQALAGLDGVAQPQQIAARVTVDPKTLARTEEHLRNAGCVVVHEDRTVEIGEAVTVESIRLLTEQERPYRSRPKTVGAAVEVRGLVRPQCNAWMPRAQARCVLRAGHAGGHRSC